MQQSAHAQCRVTGRIDPDSSGGSGRTMSRGRSPRSDITSHRGYQYDAKSRSGASHSSTQAGRETREGAHSAERQCSVQADTTGPQTYCGLTSVTTRYFSHHRVNAVVDRCGDAASVQGAPRANEARRHARMLNDGQDTSRNDTSRNDSRAAHICIAQVRNDTH